MTAPHSHSAHQRTAILTCLRCTPRMNDAATYKQEQDESTKRRENAHSAPLAHAARIQLPAYTASFFLNNNHLSSAPTQHTLPHSHLNASLPLPYGRWGRRDGNSDGAARRSLPSLHRQHSFHNFICYTCLSRVPVLLSAAYKHSPPRSMPYACRAWRSAANAATGVPATRLISPVHNAATPAALLLYCAAICLPLYCLPT